MTSGERRLTCCRGSHEFARGLVRYSHRVTLPSIAGRLFVFLLALALAACATPNPYVADNLHSAGTGHLALGDWAGAEQKYDLAISEMQSLKREAAAAAFDCRWLKNLRSGDGCEVDEGAYQVHQESLETYIAFTEQLRAFARLQQNEWSGAEADADDALRVNSTLPIALYVAARIDHRRHDNKTVRGYITKLRANNDLLSVRLAEALEQDLATTSDRESPIATRSIRDAAYLNLESIGRRPIMSEEIQHQAFTEYDSRISYELFLPPGWHKPPGKHGISGVAFSHESDPTTLYGIFRVYLLNPAFGYDPAWYPDAWSYISKNILPGIATSHRLIPYTALKLPAGWEARVSGFMGADERGRTIWVGSRYQDIVFMYTINVDPYSAKAPKDVDQYIQPYLSDIEQMVAKTRIKVLP